jgi:hypothetical protein
MDIDLSSVLNPFPGKVFTETPDGGIDFVNRNWSEFAGASLSNTGESEGRNIHPADLGNLLERWRSAISSREPSIPEYSGNEAAVGGVPQVPVKRDADNPARTS